VNSLSADFEIIHFTYHANLMSLNEIFKKVNMATRHLICLHVGTSKKAVLFIRYIV
jgi:hypothetical protein